MNAGEPSTLQQFRKINARSQTQHRVDRGAFRARTVTAKTLRLENRIDQLEDRAREQNRVIETLIDVARVREYE